MLLKSLEHDRAITGITQGIALPAISINKVVVGAIAGKAIRGPLLLSTVAGHAPNATGEVGLGATTMRQVGAHVGSIVHVTLSSASGGRRTVPFRVVAQMSLPVLGNAVSLGTGAMFTLAGYEDAACPPGPNRAACRAAGVGVNQWRDAGQCRAGSTRDRQQSTITSTATGRSPHLRSHQPR